MSALTPEQVLAYISGLRLGEVQSLVAVLEETLGVCASPDQASLSISAAYGVPEVSEIHEVDVVLDGFSGSKLDVIREVRRMTGLGLREAKACVESAPSVLRAGVDPDTADALRAALVAAGADVTLR